MGKHAALEGLAEMIDAGFDAIDISNEVEFALSQELEKNASQEDIDFRMGVESALYDFIKEAELNSYKMNTEESILTAFNKVAELDAEEEEDVYSKYNNLSKAEDAEEEEVTSVAELHQRLKTAGLF